MVWLPSERVSVIFSGLTGGTVKSTTRPFGVEAQPAQSTKTEIVKTVLISLPPALQVQAFLLSEVELNKRTPGASLR